ncbi:MAG: hypothetical protein KBG15_24590, partial [Kofleriaceae bacterium]|nr:hypothetical protein [Kofleriaceae bacterium]
MRSAPRRRPAAAAMVVSMVAAITITTALAAPADDNTRSPLVAGGAGLRPAVGVAWQPRALRAEQKLSDVCAAAPWYYGQASAQGRNLDRLAGVHLTAQRGASFWAAPATVTRIVVTQGGCTNLTVARRVGDAENFVTAQTQLPVTEFADHVRGVTLIEPAGPGAAVWLSCAEPSVVVAQTLDENPVRLAWEHARVAVRAWINADVQPLAQPPAIPGDDGSIASELQAAAWLAQRVPMQLRKNWRLAAADTALISARPSSDPYVDTNDRVPSSGATQTEIPVDNQRWGALATPWQLEVTGPAQLEWWLMQPVAATGWHGQTVTATLALDGATQITAKDIATAPIPVASPTMAFPAALDPRWGRRWSWSVTVPPGRHVVTVQATASNASDTILTRVRVVTRLP